VFANFGIAIAARMPMITTTIKSSISVKPFLLLIVNLHLGAATLRRSCIGLGATDNGNCRNRTL
jgi:hypothetical protein